MAQPPAGDGDPSMDEILASIRRILSDEEKAARAKEPGDGVLRLDPAMLVDDGVAPKPEPDHPQAAPPPAATEAKSFVELVTEATRTAGPAELLARPTSPPSPIPAPKSTPDELSPVPVTQDAVQTPARTLMAPETAAMAASSVGTLMRTLAAERNAVVYRGGPSIEDLVREEIRPLLKAWLDEHLPGLVERLVRTEIERVLGRATN